MKVKDLIEQLKTFDPELMVVRPGYEGGVTEVEHLTAILIALNVHQEWYYGEHDSVDDTTDWPEHEHAQALELT